jgi:ornithine--oxo-acid transaminase
MTAERLLEAGILAKDTHESTIRLAPPLTITREELDWALERIVPTLERADRE